MLPIAIKENIYMGNCKGQKERSVVDLVAQFCPALSPNFVIFD